MKECLTSRRRACRALPALLTIAVLGFATTGATAERRPDRATTPPDPTATLAPATSAADPALEAAVDRLRHAVAAAPPSPALGRGFEGLDMVLLARTAEGHVRALSAPPGRAFPLPRGVGGDDAPAAFLARHAAGVRRGEARRALRGPAGEDGGQPARGPAAPGVPGDPGVRRRRARPDRPGWGRVRAGRPGARQRGSARGGLRHHALHREGRRRVGGAFTRARRVIRAGPRRGRAAAHDLRALGDRRGGAEPARLALRVSAANRPGWTSWSSSTRTPGTSRSTSPRSRTRRAAPSTTPTT